MLARSPDADCWEIEHDGKVASAKNPRNWPQLFDCRAAFADVPRADVKAPSVRISLPDGTIVSTEQSNLSQILTKMFNRGVKFSALADVPTGTAEEYWPDIEGKVYIGEPWL
jgi:uncharacterized protein